MRRLLCILVALGAGWCVYMVAMVMTTYDGLLSLILQPFMGALASGLCTGLALLVGLLTRIRLIRRLWCASWVPAAVIVAASLLLMSLGSALGLVETYTNPDTGQSFKGLHYMVALTAYFAMIFAIANWPIKKAIG
jgi:hypothetical protein